MSRKIVAEVLKSKRKSSGLSVKEVASSLFSSHGIEISDKAIYSYEIGHRQPDADTLLALCVIYGIADVLSAFGYSGGKTEDNNLSECAVSVGMAFDGASAGIQESVEKLLDVDHIEKGERTLSISCNTKEA